MYFRLQWNSLKIQAHSSWKRTILGVLAKNTFTLRVDCSEWSFSSSILLLQIANSPASKLHHLERMNAAYRIQNTTHAIKILQCISSLETTPWKYAPRMPEVMKGWWIEHEMEEPCSVDFFFFFFFFSWESWFFFFFPRNKLFSFITVQSLCYAHHAHTGYRMCSA